MSLKIGFNFVPFPQSIWDDMMDLSEGEFKLLGYIIRHTVGFRKSEVALNDEELLNGRKKKNGIDRYDRGCGISSPNTLKKAREKLIKLDFIERVGKNYIAKLDDEFYNNRQNIISENDTMNCQKLTPRVSETDTSRYIEGKDNYKDRENFERKPTHSMTGIPQGIENVLRNEGVTSSVIEILGRDIGTIVFLTQSPVFTNGRGLEKVIRTFAQLCGTGVNVPFDKLPDALSRWQDTLKRLPKGRGYSKWGLCGWIENMGWNLVEAPTTTWVEKLSANYPKLSVQLITDFQGESPEFYKTLEANQDEILRISQERQLPKHEFRDLVIERMKSNV